MRIRNTDFVIPVNFLTRSRIISNRLRNTANRLCLCVCRKSVVEHMHRLGGYSQEDFLRVESAANSGGGGGGSNTTVATTPAPPPSQPVPAAASLGGSGGTWTEADFLPPGFYLCFCAHNNINQ